MEDKEKEQLKQFLIDNKSLVDQKRFEELLILACNDKNIDEENLYELLKKSNLNLNCDLESIRNQCFEEKINRLKTMETIPDHFFENNQMFFAIDIENNIKRFGNNCFKNCHNLKTIRFHDDAMIGGVSGSHIFDGCENIKEIYADKAESLHFKHDNGECPFKKQTKIYVNGKEILPLLLTYEHIPHTWDNNGKRLKITFDNERVKKYLNKEIIEETQINNTKYYELVSKLYQYNHSLQQTNSQPKPIDKDYHTLNYSYMGMSFKVSCGDLQQNKYLSEIVEFILSL